MKKLLLSGMFTLIMTLSLFAQQPDRKPMPSADRAKNTVDRISQTVVFTKQQKEKVIAIFTKFYDDIRAQQAFRDPSKMDPLEKARDGKVEKLLNNPKLYKQYQDAVKEMKTQFRERQHPPKKP
jgi:long-subunit acyl-CoA synthetase (AMP-forming)